MPAQLSADERAFALALRALSSGISVREIARRVGVYRQERGGGKGPHHSSISRLLRLESFTDERIPAGRTPKTTEKEQAKLPAIIDKLEEKNPYATVTATMTSEAWATKKKLHKSSVSRILRKQGRGFKRPLKKAPLTSLVVYVGPLPVLRPLFTACILPQGDPSPICSGLPVLA